MSAQDYNANIAIFYALSNLSYIVFWEICNASYNGVCRIMYHSKIFDYMESKKLTKRKKQDNKYIEVLNESVTYILDDVKETIVTENTYKAIPYNVLKTYFLLKGIF